MEYSVLISDGNPSYFIPHTIYYSVISHLRGKIISSSLKSAVIDVGSVGYKIFATPETLSGIAKNPENVSVFTYLAVRENALDLYGFEKEEELNFFELLISISGIGPKSALTILSSAGLTTLKGAVASGNASHLSKISGIGRKNAEKIVLELHGKLGVSEGEENQNLQTGSDAIEALQALGYSQKEARDALKKVPKEIEAISEIVKQALKILGTR